MSLTDFLMPVSIAEINEDEGFNEGQLANHISVYEHFLPDLQEADIVFLGVTENRGEGNAQHVTHAANVIRKHLYKLFYWHPDIKLADIGNIKAGALLTDSYAAIQSELANLIEQGKTVILLGGSHDITLAQYAAYRQLQKSIEVAVIDATIDLDQDSHTPAHHFLMPLLTSEPNYVSHYNHLAFQSYYVHPRMLETIGKLGFDCVRVGKVQENIEEIEPLLRNSHMLSLDISAIKNSDAPANLLCPNGLTGQEACILAKYAGMSHDLSSFGIYGYNPALDKDELTARQISQIIWYFLDGKSKSKQEAPITDSSAYNEYHTSFGPVETVFIQNRRTHRWWMQMPDKKFVACTYKDFLKASNGDIPERWIRIQERM